MQLLWHVIIAASFGVSGFEYEYPWRLNNLRVLVSALLGTNLAFVPGQLNSRTTGQPQASFDYRTFGVCCFGFLLHFHTQSLKFPHFSAGKTRSGISSPFLHFPRRSFPLSLSRRLALSFV